MAERVIKSELDSLIGTSVVIDHALINKKRLFSSQNWVDENRVRSLLLDRDDPVQQKMSVDVFLKKVKGKMRKCYLVGEGHHRSALCIINSEPVSAEITGVINDPKSKKMWGFNKVVTQFRKIAK